MKQYQKLQVDCTPSVPARETRRMASILEPLVLILAPRNSCRLRSVRLSTGGIADVRRGCSGNRRVLPQF